MHWNERLRQLIGGRGQPTQQQIADRMKVSRSFVSQQMVRGDLPGPDVVIEFAKALGITTADLLADVEDKYDVLRRPQSSVKRKGA